ncbi:MAG: helix-turn-helix domain-containing protein [Chlorobi bacterium]|nr:helix-turn-helix domain-containing protein [Chlorobiota bacterium]
MMKKSCILLFLFLFLFLNSIDAQDKKIDSLKQELSGISNDSLRCLILNNIANAYIFENPDSAFFYADKTLMYSENKKYYENIGDSYRLKGIVCIMKADTKNAEKYFKLSYKYFRMLNKDDDKYRSAYYINMNILYIQQPNYSKALLYADSAMIILKNKNDSLSMSNLAKLYTNKSNIFNDQGLFREAIECNLKAIELTDKTGEKNRKEINYLNMGNSFGYLREYDKAIKYFYMAENTAKENQNNYMLIKALNNLASMYDKKKEYRRSVEINLKLVDFLDSLHIENKKVLAFVTLSQSYNMLGKTKKVEEFLEKSLKIAEKYNDEGLKLLAYTNYEILMIKHGKIKQGIIYADKALKIAKAQNNLNSLIDIYQSKYKAYEKTGQLDSSIYYLKKYQDLKESIENEKVKKDIYNLEIKYQTAEKEKENQKLQFENTLQKTKIKQTRKTKNIFLFSLILAFILLSIIFNLLKRKSKIYKILVKRFNELKEKEKELKIVKKQLNYSENRESAFTDEKKEELLSKIENEFEINKIYKENISLQKLAEKLNTNTSYLSGIINNTYKTSFSDFLNHYRIQEAVDLFNNPDFINYSTEAIGKESGFNSDKTFVRAFKKHIGVTPSYFRKNNRQI